MGSILRKAVIRMTPVLCKADIWQLRHNNNRIETDEQRAAAKGRVALVRLDAIGDFVIWLDSAAEFRRQFAGRHIILICNKACKGIAEASGLFDEIVPVDTGRLNYAGNFRFRKELSHELERINVELLIQTAFSRRVYTDVVSAAVRAEKKLTIRDRSFDNASQGALKATDTIYDSVIDAGDGHVMELVRNAEFVRKVTGSTFRASVPVLRATEVPDGMIPEGDYFVVFPGGSFRAKMWPIERFAQAAQFIHDTTGWKCCVCGSPDEKYLANGLTSHYNGDVIDMTGKTTLLQSIEVIRHAKLLIGNDTSGIHFAAATGTKAVCVFGGWHYGRFLPYKIESGQLSGGNDNDINNNDINKCMPAVCVHDMECFNCRIVDRTSQCQKHMKDTGLFTCVDMVSVQDVTDVLKNVLRELQI